MTSQLAAHSMDDHNKKQGISALGWLAMALGTVIVGYLVYYNIAHLHSGGGSHDAHLPPAWGLGILPFVGILGCIAVLPLIPKTHHWWESNINRLGVAIGCSGLTLLYYGVFVGWDRIVPVLNHAIPGEYIPFIVLLFALYVISGGISLKGDLAAHPGTNTAFLAFGAAIASFIGTTGASMLLIRPLLQTNSERRHVVHTVVFFIFLVSNIGGTLLPIGDPPLFLGYLRGVDFFWTMTLWQPWAITCVILLVVYYIWDTFAYKREAKADIKRDETEKQPLRIKGIGNIFLLGGVIAAVAFLKPGEAIPGTSFVVFPFMRELVMLGLVGLSVFAVTPKGVREDNDFNYAAILEVAALFVGIFIAMQVPLEVLGASGSELSAFINRPWHYFWATGILSSCLDNAPTYVVFFELARTMPEGADALSLGANGMMNVGLLVAISLGSVFMGAMTYIGNGPNFMVKAIAEQSGIRMPSFFGYVFKYSLPILVPIFVLVTLLFLRGEGPGPADASSSAHDAHADTPALIHDETGH